MKRFRRISITVIGGILFVSATTATYFSLPVRGQVTNPALSITLTNTNQLWLTVTNGTVNATYLIYSNRFLDTNFDWNVVTNGSAAQTSFILPQGKSSAVFYKARYNTNYFPFVLTVTIVSPSNGANVQ